MPWITQKRTLYSRDENDRPFYKHFWVVKNDCGEYLKNPKRFYITDDASEANQFWDLEGADISTATMNQFDKETEAWRERVFA